MAESVLHDWGMGQNTRHTMVALLQQSIFGRLGGDEDTNDAERLSVDPLMRYVVGGRARTRPVREVILDMDSSVIDLLENKS